MTDHIIGALIALAIAILFAAFGPVRAATPLTGADRGQWISGLLNARKDRCCDEADGYDVFWEATPGGSGYRVKLLGKWVDVPPEALIAGPNRIGQAMIWLNAASFDATGALTGYTNIRCFLPGAGF